MCYSSSLQSFYQLICTESQTLVLVVASAAGESFQVMVVPISENSAQYAFDVRRELRAAGLHADVDASDRKMQKKVDAGISKTLPAEIFHQMRWCGDGHAGLC